MPADLQEVKFRIYNSKLDPGIWDENMSLNPDIKIKLLKVAQDFYANTELNSPIIDILFLGSVTNFNWTSTSDIDLHIVIDITKENIAPEHRRQFMDGLGAGWNNSHEIYIKGHPVEVYLQDITEKNSTPQQARAGSTMYSILKDCWLKKPDRNRVEVDKEKIKQKYHKIKTMVDDFISKKDVTKLKKLMKSLKNYRNVGLGRTGEFSTENLVFKALRHTNVITKLKDAINSLYDKSVSVNEELTKPNDLYLVVGYTNSDFKVVGKKDTVGATEDNRMKMVLHGDFYMPYSEFGLYWRYKSKNNTLYWWNGKSSDYNHIDPIKLEKMKNVTFDYLKTKYGVDNPLELFSPTKYHTDAHRINETKIHQKT